MDSVCLTIRYYAYRKQYGFYEYFKKTYSDMAGPTNAKKYKDAIFLAGSASAEFLADMALVPVSTLPCSAPYIALMQCKKVAKLC